jgi:hypothetical protein
LSNLDDTAIKKSFKCRSMAKNNWGEYMRKLLPILVVSTVLLTGCMSIESTDTVLNTSNNELETEKSEDQRKEKVQESPKEADIPTEPELPTLNPIINVTDIARKSLEDVEIILGKPVYSEDINFGMGPDLKKAPVTLSYYIEMLEGDLGRVEIMFVEGKAQRIRVNLIGEQYIKDDKSRNFEYLGFQGIVLEKPKSEVQRARYARDTKGFYSIEVNDWLGTDDGTILVITEEAYR